MSKTKKNQGVAPCSVEKKTVKARIQKELKQNAELYIMFLPAVIFFLIFAYKPMYGLIMAFQDFSPSRGILGSEWVGFKHFQEFFSSFYFGRLIKNTVVISFTSIVVSFPLPIILSLLMNEIRNKKFKSLVQTASYLPHFISLVVICGMVKKFTSETGVITSLLTLFGFEETNLLNNPDYFVPIYVISGLWQEMGWNSIIYLAAISGISQELYEAAMIDGAGRFRQTLHVTIPGLAPTIIITFILRMGSVLSVGYEKILLLSNPLTMKVAQVISVYVYERGLQDQDWSFSVAVGLFNSVINFLFLLITNKVAKKVSDTRLW